jgi:multidrug efflux system outer membrane protein
MSQRNLFRKILLLVAAVLMPSCTVGPKYHGTNVNVPSSFRGAQGAAQQASFADLPWWEIFKDETLKTLVKTALANNYDVAIAATRVEQARQVAAQAHSLYYPLFDYKTRLSEGKNQLLSSPSTGQGGVLALVMTVVTVSWEADIWGRIRRLNEAAKAEYLGTSEARRGVMLTLVSDLSSAYFRLLGLRLQLEIAMRSEDTFDQSRKLFTLRLEGGVSSMLPVSRAAANQETAAAQVAEYKREIAITEDQIRVLLGQNPGPIESAAKLLGETVPPEIPPGLPSALLKRRPDILSAEENVRAANARIGVAKADYFPKIGLTGFFGKLSSPLENYTNGSTTLGSIGVGAEGPIFQGGRLKARKREAVAAWEQATLQYQQTVVNAFRDVSDALISCQQYQEERGRQARAVESLQEAVRLANMRYDQGFSSYYEVLEAQQLLFPAEQALAQTELDLRLVIVQLYKALGGGWNLNDEQFQNAVR